MASEGVAGPLCIVLESVIAQEKDSVSDLQKYCDALEQLLVLLKSIERGCEDSRTSLGQEEWARLVAVSAGHLGSHYWTTRTTRKLANELLTYLCQLKGYSKPQLLFADEGVLLELVLSRLQGSLHKNNWREKSVAKQALVWLVQQLKHPHVSAHLGYFLPPLLWMLDDYTDYNRVLALQVIAHILPNTDPTEMRWHGRADVLYQAMKPLLYVSSSDVVHALFPCLLLLLPVIDYCPSPPIPAKVSKADKVFSTLITNLAREPKLSLKRAYSAQVSCYIRYLGIYATRHIKDVLPALLSLLVYADPEKEKFRRNALEALLSLISCCWPRMATHQVEIIKALAELSEQTDSHDVHQLVVKCLSLLLAAVPELKAESGYLYTCCEHYPHFRSSLQLATASSDQSHATQESTEHVQNQES